MDYAVYSAKEEKNLYDSLKKGMPYVLTELQKNEVEILSILEKLGFPMSQLGTYLYKDVIVEACNIINEGEITSNNKRRKLIARLNDGYDEIYKQIASEDKEIGCKTFHSYIEGAIKDIDETRTDTSLAEKIYGDKDITYGTAAFRIADYYLNEYSYDYGRTKVKKLNNMNDISDQKLILK